MRTKPLLLSVLALAVLGLMLTNCRPKYPKCNNDEHCSERSEFCVNGMCQQCRDASNCETCQQCSAGKCTAILGCCVTDANCAAGQKCRDGRCGPQCLAKEECGAKEICQGGRCVPVACFATTDCPAGQECVNNDCVTPAVQECSIDAVFFDFDSYALRPDAKGTLDSNLECMKEKAVTSLRIEGHCDERGTEAYNLTLGDRRARAARNYLKKRGVKKLRTVSYGENRPLDPGSGEGAWSQNRRAEIKPQ